MKRVIVFFTASILLSIFAAGVWGIIPFSSKSSYNSHASLLKAIPIVQVTASPYRERGTDRNGNECVCPLHCAGFCNAHLWVLGFQLLKTGEKHVYMSFEETGVSSGILKIWPKNGSDFDPLEPMVVDELVDFDGDIADALGYSRITLNEGSYSYQSSIGTGGYAILATFQE